MSTRDELNEQARTRIGQVLKGKYTIDDVLGVGGMAVVYAATHRNKKRVAVKMLHLELSHVSHVKARFVREGYVANSVGHPGALEVLDDDVSDDGAAFLVMELLDGEPVDIVAAGHDGVLPERAVLALGATLLDVLSKAHASAVVHRDIKPANLFITREGKLKVLDFGIARLRDAASSDATGTGVILGTPSFMPPEQAYGRTAEIDGQTDVWAVGATLFHLLTGRGVHTGTTASEIVIRSATVPAPPIRSIKPDVNERIAEVVDKALAFEKGSRWATAAAMRDAIRAIERESFAGAEDATTALSGLLSQSEGKEKKALPVIVTAATQAAPPGSQPGAPLASRVTPLPPPRASAPAFVPSASGVTGVPVTRSNPPKSGMSPTVRAAVSGIALALALGVVGAGVILMRARPAGDTALAASAVQGAPPQAPTPPQAVAPPAVTAPTPEPPVTASATQPAQPATPVPAASAPTVTQSAAPPPSHAAHPPRTATPASSAPAKPTRPVTKPSDDDSFHP